MRRISHDAPAIRHDFSDDHAGKDRAADQIIAGKTRRDGHEPDRERDGRERAGREDRQLGDDRGEHRGRDRPHPHHDLRILVEPARRDKTEKAPDFVRQEADQDQQQ